MTGHIFIEGEIGYDVTAKTVRNDISQYPQATEFMVHINSGGGDVYEGYQIGSILRSLGKPTKAAIGSMCASIATAIAMSCNKVSMSPQGDFMIHLPTAGMEGTAEDLRKGAEQLDRIKTELINLYYPRVSRKGITREQLSAMIEQETSMSPIQALEMGFIDEMEQQLKAVAKLDIKKFNDMEKSTLTREEAEGMFTRFGERLDKFFAKFKNAVQIALVDGMVTSTANTPEELIGSVVSNDQGPLKDGSYETADGFLLVVSGGNGTVADYGPKVEDKKEDSGKALEAAQAEIAALKDQLAAKTNEAGQAVQAKAKIEKEFSAEFKNIKDELEKLQKETFGEKEVPAGQEFKFKNNEGTERHDPMGGLWESFVTSR